MEASFVLYEEKMSQVLFEATFTSGSTSLKHKTWEFEGCPCLRGHSLLMSLEFKVKLTKNLCTGRWKEGRIGLQVFEKLNFAASGVHYEPHPHRLASSI